MPVRVPRSSYGRRRALATAILPALCSVAALSLIRCDRKQDPIQVAPSASALSESSADPRSLVWHYTIDPASAAHVDMPGPKEHIRGDTSAAEGSIDVVPGDLSQSRGQVRIDLATFATHTFDNKDDALQTKDARTWLEVQVGDRINESMRWADFAIRSIDGLSVNTLPEAPLVGSGRGDERKVTMTAHGELLVHGHKIDKGALLEVAFLYPPGAAPGAKPTRIRIRSREPIRVSLKEHDIRPRDPASQVLAWTTELISKVTENADVAIDVSATPAD